jgi:NAD-dependent deacetylase
VAEPLPPSADLGALEPELREAILELRAECARAKKIAVMIGAGASAEVGVPTFRGAGGLWNGLRAEELATPQAFARDPLRVSTWYAERRATLAAIEPGPAHFALAALERAVTARGGRFLLISQNVDGLHRRAGVRSYVDLHGTLLLDRCSRCSRERAVELGSSRELPPRCAACGALERPAVVWFGEALSPQDWELAAAAASASELFLAVGTSAVVEPAASLARLAVAHGARFFELNLEETPNSASAQRTLRAPAGAVLPLLV